MSGEKLWTISDVATFLSVTNKTVYRLVQRGRIPAFKMGWMWRFREAEIRQWLEGLRHSERPGPRRSRDGREGGPC